MEILIPGALPPPALAPELIQYLESTCPALVERFRRSTIAHIPLHPDVTGCTPFESVELQRKGFIPAAQSNLSAGLGPLRAGVQQPGEFVWVAELSSVAIATEGPSLITPERLQITQEEADALYESVNSLWIGSPISALPLSPARWRIWLPDQPVMSSASPDAIAGFALADWWPQHPSLRGWRKLLNEIQMVWHDHPVNAARAEHGLPPINSLWLYGGGQAWKQAVTKDLTLYTGLQEGLAQQDWAGWISALPDLSNYIAALPQASVLTLLGQQHAVQLGPVKTNWWRSLIPTKQHHWKSWWNLPN